MNRLTLMQTQDPVIARRSSSSVRSRTNLATADTDHPPSAALPGTLHAPLHILPSSGSDRIALKTVDTLPSRVALIGTDVSASAANAAPHDAAQTDTHVRECTMLVTINADCVNELRHLMMRTCGRLLVFIRTQPVAHAKK